jgi:transposase-like protein
VRNKVSREIKAEAANLYMEGLSLRAIARKYGVCKETVRKWIMKFEEAFARKKLARKKEREVILLDETKVKRNGRMLTSLCALISNAEKSFHLLLQGRYHLYPRSSY